MATVETHVKELSSTSPATTNTLLYVRSTWLNPSKDGSLEHLSTVPGSSDGTSRGRSDNATSTEVCPLQQQWAGSLHLAADVRNSFFCYSSSSCPSCDDDNDGDENTTHLRNPTFNSATAPVNNSSWADSGNMPRALSVAVEKEVFGDRTKKKSLLTEPHIRLLMFTYGLYWVRRGSLAVGSGDKRGKVRSVLRGAER